MSIPSMRSAVRHLRACTLASLLLVSAAYAEGLAQPPAMLHAAVPEYPAGARRREEEGTVHLRVRVLAAGEAGDVQVSKSSGSKELDQAAIAAVKASTFRAARDAAGLPVDALVTVPYRFVLQD